MIRHINVPNTGAPVSFAFNNRFKIGLTQLSQQSFRHYHNFTFWSGSQTKAAVQLQQKIKEATPKLVSQTYSPFDPNTILNNENAASSSPEKLNQLALNQVLYSAKESALSFRELFSFDQRLKIAEQIVNEINDGILYQSGPLSHFLADMIPPQIAQALKTKEELITAHLEFVGVGSHGLSSWKKLADLVEKETLSLSPKALYSLIFSPSNFVPLAQNQIINSIITGSSVIFPAHEKTPHVDRRLFDLIKRRFLGIIKDVYPKKHSSDLAHYLQFVVTDVEGKGILASDPDGTILFTGSTKAARALRTQGKKLENIAAECGSNANLAVIEEKWILESVGGNVEQLDESSRWAKVKDALVSDMTYAYGQQCTSVGLIAFVGDNTFYDAAVSSLISQLQDIPARPVTGKPDFSNQNGNWVLVPKPLGTNHTYSPGIKELSSTSSSLREYWHASSNTTRIDPSTAISDIVSIHGRYPALSTGLHASERLIFDLFSHPHFSAPMSSLKSVPQVAARPEQGELFRGSSSGGNYSTAVGEDTPVGSELVFNPYITLSYNKQLDGCYETLTDYEKHIINKAKIDIDKHKQAIQFIADCKRYGPFPGYKIQTSFAYNNLSNRLPVSGLRPSNVPSIIRIDNREDFEIALLVQLGLHNLSDKNNVEWSIHPDLKLSSEIQKLLASKNVDCFLEDSLVNRLTSKNNSPLIATALPLQDGPLAHYIARQNGPYISMCTINSTRRLALKHPLQLCRIVLEEFHTKAPFSEKNELFLQSLADIIIGK